MMDVLAVTTASDLPNVISFQSSCSGGRLAMLCKQFLEALLRPCFLFVQLSKPQTRLTICDRVPAGSTNTAWRTNQDDDCALWDPGGNATLLQHLGVCSPLYETSRRHPASTTSFRFPHHLSLETFPHFLKPTPFSPDTRICKA